jgi:hypothetical protein
MLSIGEMIRTSARIDGLVGRLISAEPDQLPGIIQELDQHPKAADSYLGPLLTAEAQTPDERRAQ